MRYLVTGGAGFLGSHLVRSLLADGHDVIALDNFCTGQRENINDLIQLRNLELHIGDVCDQKTITPHNFGHLDGIYNCACPASPVHYQNIPIQTTLSSVVGVHNLLNLAHHKGCRILQTSTSEVYGDPTISPQPESYVGHVNCYGPRACYDEGKRAAEALCYDYKRVMGVDTRIVRIFNTYGPNMCVDDGRVVSNFIVQSLKNEPITIYGDGQQTRSFCYVSDLITGLRMFFEQNTITGPMNLGNPGEFTMIELAEKICKITGSKSTIKHMPLPGDDPKQRRPDISLAKSMGWEPKINLDSGLVNTIQYFSDKLTGV